MNARAIKLAVMLLVACSAVCLIVKNITFLKREDVYPAPDFNALRVVVIPSKKQVRVGERFELELRVENISQEIQKIAVWTCSWDEGWGWGTYEVSYDVWGCNGNCPISEEIRPGGAYTKKLTVFVKNPVQSGKILLRMSFASFKDFLIGKDQARNEYYQPIWSEPVTIEVVP